MNFVDAVQNPQLIIRKVLGKLRRRNAHIPAYGMREQMHGGVVFEHKRLSFLDDEDMRAMASNSYDIILCDCFRRHLSAGDIVLDVGANIGYISAIAASRVGTSGEVHGFEPLAECFARLEVLSSANPTFRFFFNNAAIGSEKGSVSIGFNSQGDIRNATLVPGKKTSDTRQVPVWRLDDYILERISAPERIRIIKIDVEGFEFPVLKGLERFFSTTGLRPLIVCEIKPWEIQNIGHTMTEFDDYMRKFGYKPYDMVGESRVIDLKTLRDLETVLFRAS